MLKEISFYDFSQMTIIGEMKIQYINDVQTTYGKHFVFREIFNFLFC